MLALLTLDRELTMGVTLGIVLGDVDRVKLGNTFENDRDIIDNNLSVLVTLQKQKPAGVLVIVGVDSGHRDLFLDAHIV